MVDRLARFARTAWPMLCSAMSASASGVGSVIESATLWSASVLGKSVRRFWDALCDPYGNFIDLLDEAEGVF